MHLSTHTKFTSDVDTANQFKWNCFILQHIGFLLDKQYAKKRWSLLEQKEEKYKLSQKKNAIAYSTVNSELVK